MRPTLAAALLLLLAPAAASAQSTACVDGLDAAARLLSSPCPAPPLQPYGPDAALAAPPPLPPPLSHPPDNAAAAPLFAPALPPPIAPDYALSPLAQQAASDRSTREAAKRRAEYLRQQREASATPGE